jgi:hypothetical protein
VEDRFLDKECQAVEQKRELIAMLITRLERLSVDSYWAHRASGVRGSLLKMFKVDNLETSQAAKLIERGFDFLEKAAKEK